MDHLFVLFSIINDVKNGKSQDDVMGVTNCNDKSVELNFIINVKMSEKLRLSDTKCFKLHIGKTKRLCMMKRKVMMNQ